MTRTFQKKLKLPIIIKNIYSYRAKSKLSKNIPIHWDLIMIFLIISLEKWSLNAQDKGVQHSDGIQKIKLVVH